MKHSGGNRTENRICNSTDAAADSLYRLVDELTERVLRGEPVDFEQELRSRPAHADQLREAFAALDLMGMIQHSRSMPGGDRTGAPPEHAEARVLGDFRILREIGRGGMGVVYEAEQISLGRRVALKVFPFAGICAPRQLQRFQHEARAAAILHHPHIVPVFAVGCERGLHFYAMQYIEGRSLACLIDGLRNRAVVGERTEQAGVQPRLANESTQSFAATGSTAIAPEQVCFRQVAEWGAQAAEALDYAHAAGIVHRDVKPGNLLVDTEGRLWVTDFGLAQMASAGDLTMTGDILGTLRYMSPEQSVGERGLLDQRTDVYSLGATMYELLTLQAVFCGSDRAELLHKILHDDPAPLRRLNPAVPGELATIVHKALERDLSARYATAAQVAEDLRRFLAGTPILAKPLTIADRWRRWSLRHRGLVRLAMACCGVVLAVLALTFILIKEERDKTRLEQQAREANERVAQVALAGLAVNRYVTQINLAERAFKAGRFAEARELLKECIPAAEEEDLRNFEWHYLWHATRDRDPPIGSHQGMAYCARLSPDGRLLATGGSDGVRLWDPKSFVPLGHLTAHQADVNGVAFSPDGSRMVTAGDDHMVRVWTTRDWKVERVIPHAGNVVAAMFVPGKNLLVSAERHYYDESGALRGEDVVRLWDAQTGESRGTLQRHDDEIQSLDVSADGSQIATGSSDGTACLWDLNENRQRQLVTHSPAGPVTGVHCVAFARDGSLLATASSDGAVRIWNTADGSHRATLLTDESRLEFVTFSPDNRLLAAGGHTSVVSVWNWNSQVGNQRRPEMTLRSNAEMWGAAFLDDQRLVTVGRDGSIRKWDARDLFEFRRLPVDPGRSEEPPFFSRNEVRWASENTHPPVPVSDEPRRLAGMSRLLPLEAGDDLIVAGRANVAAVVKSSGRVQVWRDGRLLWEGDRRLKGFRVGALSADGSRLAMVGDEGTIDVVRTADGKSELEFVADPSPSRIALSPDGATLAALGGSAIETIRLWNTRTGRPLLTFEIGSGPVSLHKFSADGRSLLALVDNIFGNREVYEWATSPGPRP